jgi:hypothetical protein
LWFIAAMTSGHGGTAAPVRPVRCSRNASRDDVGWAVRDLGHLAA